MADISQYTSNILNSARGEVVRDSIIGAVKTIDNNTEYAERLDGRLPTDFVMYVDQQEKLDCDELPTNGSPRPVESGGLYTVIGDLYDESLLTSDTILYKLFVIDDIIQGILKELDSKLNEAYMPGIPHSAEDELGNCEYYYSFLLVGTAIRSLYDRRYIAKHITRNGTYTADEGTAWSSIVVDVLPTEPVPYDGIITQNGTYNAPVGYSYTKVTVDVPPQPFVYEYNRSTGVAHTNCIFYTPVEENDQ